MDVSRRDFTVAGAVALGTSGLLLSGFAGAEPADEAAVKEGVEILRKALLEADKTRLEQVASAQISYGHSDERVETKEQFINGVMTRKQTTTKIGALQVWQKQDGAWKLLARQGFRLPA